ncbi:hypothetical protein JCM33374_g2657 [Metschnikowia sp. JCM 33374]|nr:hypothetical protein JCM33374_g2657 [Metschnikowia sp. JCM 33374]
MKINPAHLIALRNEYSLLSYGPRCFAIVWGNDPNIPSDLVSFALSINKYNPHRVQLDVSRFYSDYTSRAFAVVEMKYRTPIQQKYFTYLMALLSKRVSAWIHVWDTLEHDALRRDFDAPGYMDSELSINRLWFKGDSVFLVCKGYTPDNSHGEFVPELSLQEAMDELVAGRGEKNEGLTNQLSAHFSAPHQAHLLEHVSDITNVYLPRNLASLVLRHVHWIELPDLNEIDPTNIVLDAIPASASLDDEVAFTVAVSDANIDNFQGDKSFSSGLTPAQWLSLSIKINVNKAFSEIKDNAEETIRLQEHIGKHVGENIFSSSFTMQRLYEQGLSNSKMAAKSVNCEDLRLAFNWDKPVCVLTNEERKVYEELQKQDWHASDEDSESVENPDLDKASPENKPFFTGLEDTGEFAEHFSAKNIWGKVSAALDDPQLSDRTHALSEKDLEKTGDLEDFDDFVEYYATHFLGYNEEDLEQHRVQPPQTRSKSQGENTKNEKNKFDWEMYNNDSDYVSDDSSGSEVEV